MPKSIRLFLFLLLTAVTIVACGKKETQSATQEAIVTPYHATSVAFANKDYQSAVELATAVMDRDGESVEGLTYRGVAYAKLNKPYYAFGDLLTAVSMDYNETTLMNLGAALRMFGYCARATDAFQQALALSPNNPRILINLSSSYMCYGEYDAAGEYFYQATQNFEKNAISYTNAAILKALEGDFEQSRTAANKALDMDALYKPAYKILAYACKNLGDRDCANRAETQHKNLSGATFKAKKTQFVPRSR